jgi:hypothetical protein
LVVAVIAAMGAALVATVFLLARRAPNATTPAGEAASRSAAASAASAAPRDGFDEPLGFADAPMSPTTSDVARAKLKEGLGLMASGDDAEPALDAALEADPTFAAAALQRAYYAFWLARPLAPKDRSAFHAALTERDQLAPRDRALLDALAPSFGDPPDWKESEVRVRAYLAAHPRDGQAWNALGILVTKEGLLDKAPEAFSREAALATTEVAAHQVWAQVEWSLGHHDESLRVLADCIARKPASVDCRSQWARFAAASGDCQAMDRLAREMTALAPDSPTGWTYRASAAAALGASDEAIEELQATSVSHVVPAADQPRRKLWASLSLAYRHGDLAECLRLVDAIEQTPPPAGWDIGSLSGVEETRVGLLYEAGDKRGAARAAQAFLKRLPALPDPERSGYDSSPGLYAYAYAGGAIDFATLSARRRAWLDQQRAKLGEEAWPLQRLILWSQAFDAPDVPARAEAEQAFAVLEELGGAELGEPENYEKPTLNVGTFLLGAGRLAEAERWLGVAGSVCAMAPLVQIDARLGRAREGQGDVAGACRAYGAALAGWPDPKPRSVTIDDVRSRARHLGCGTR